MHLARKAGDYQKTRTVGRTLAISTALHDKTAENPPIFQSHVSILSLLPMLLTSFAGISIRDMGWLLQLVGAKVHPLLAENGFSFESDDRLH
ncbi:hypothetical protein [Polaromonas sp. YR568]|uniref:hypothetical protein n=1 Tax=Polaromonas sp. YR568 TaxID=1855301 RepID=UPI0031378C1A